MSSREIVGSAWYQLTSEGNLFWYTVCQCAFLSISPTTVSQKMNSSPFAKHHTLAFSLSLAISGRK